MNNEVMVSICCLVYNHGKYLRQCLDGFLMQKDVTFEVLLHDDASTDNSADIIREYEKKYPDIVKPIYQKENQFKKDMHISIRFQYPRAKGRYIASCEGDDYWTDPYKLKKQVDALEQHPDAHTCVHKVQAVAENGDIIDYTYPQIQLRTGVIPQKEAMNIILWKGYQFHTSSFFMRASVFQGYFRNPPEFVLKYHVGDTPQMLYFGNAGDFVYIDEVMSHRRIGSAFSWNKAMKEEGTSLEYYQTALDGLRSFDEYSGHKYHLESKIALREAQCLSIQGKDKEAFKSAWKNRKVIDKGRLIHLWSTAYCPFLYSVFYGIREIKFKVQRLFGK